MEVETYVALQGSDRGFARAMASAALRQLGRINLALGPVLDRPLETAPPNVRSLLQIGAAQIWLMETPVHAAVGETVEVAKQWLQPRKAAGFLNAVLRKLPAAKDRFDGLPAEAIWPDWFKQTLRAHLSADTVTELAQMQMEVPQLHFTAKTGDGSALARMLDADWLTGPSVACSASDVSTLPSYQIGDWWVQDAAAALPAQLLGGAPGQTVVDLCAAPGGKTLQLAAMGAHVLAVDRSKARLKRVEENLARTGLSANVTLTAARGEDWSPTDSVDAVLVDAPCSALGTLRRHPEGPWIKRPDEIAGYPEVQMRLLRAGLDMVKPGGRVVYCVCSPLRQEGADVVESILKKGAIVRDPIKATEVKGFESAVTETGDIVTLPGNGFAHDAFYVARLRKIA